MRHVQVRRGGKLELIGIEIMDSTGSSALFSEGDLTVTNCSFSRCVAGTNDIMRSVDSAVTTGGAALRALGGAIQARGTEATLRSTGSSFVACAAQGAKFANHGGAVYAAAMVHIDTTRFDSNYVEGGSFETGGGALYIQARRLDIADSEFISNKAIGHVAATGGAVRLEDCTSFMTLVTDNFTDRFPNFCTGAKSDCGAELRAVTFRHNEASGGSSRVKGGALYVTYPALCVNLTDSSFETNSAEDSKGNTEGGAVQVNQDSILKIETSRFVRNTAKGATDQVRSPSHCNHSVTAQHLHAHTTMYTHARTRILEWHKSSSDEATP